MALRARWDPVHDSLLRGALWNRGLLRRAERDDLRLSGTSAGVFEGSRVR